jgi:hypothetical protein
MFPGEIVYIDPKTGGCVRAFPFKIDSEIAEDYTQFGNVLQEYLDRLREKREIAGLNYPPLKWRGFTA